MDDKTTYGTSTQLKIRRDDSTYHSLHVAAPQHNLGQLEAAKHRVGAFVHGKSRARELPLGGNTLFKVGIVRVYVIPSSEVANHKKSKPTMLRPFLTLRFRNYSLNYFRSKVVFSR
jgi:hypothetical protein